MEIPPSFLTFERFEPLFSDARKPIRDFALEFSRWEFARWNPPVHSILKLSESPHAEVRQFVAQALLADDKPETRPYRLDPSMLSPQAVYEFCESAEENTRTLGMELIHRSPKLQLPEELFRLTESPDRKVRTFVVRVLWSLYRDRGIKEGWKPTPPPASLLAANKREPKDFGPGAPDRPEQLPASVAELVHFLRRILFEIPPRREAHEKLDSLGVEQKLKPLPARQGKLALVEVIRDLALDERDMATIAVPVLTEFMRSRGESERLACLVALTRLRAKWGAPVLA